MKRVNYYMAFMLLFCLPHMLFAQLPKGVILPPGDGQGGSVDRTINLQDCDLTYRFTVIVQNLDILNGVDYSQWNYTQGFPPDLALPVGYPPMSLRCEINGISEIVEVDSFYYYIHPSPLIGTIGFVFEHYMTIDVSDHCEGQPASTIDTLDVQMSLLHSNPFQLVVYYPMCNYMSAGDLFDCAYLPNTTCPVIPCSNSVWANWQGNPTYECGDECGDRELVIDPPINTIPATGREASEDEQSHVGTEEAAASKETDQTALALEIHPNPFGSTLNIHWKSDAKTTTIRLYHSNGQLVKSWINPAHSTGDMLKINTEDLPNGIYFLQIQNGERNIYKKLIKT